MSSNPFANDVDRSAIWTMLMPRDFQAFASADWSMVAGDFDEIRFLGIHAHNSSDPDDWTLAFPRLEDYRDEWLRQAAASAKVAYAGPLVPALLNAVRLDRIDIAGDVAVAHKIFDGQIPFAGGGSERLSWRTVYHCRKNGGRWQISGFTGYLPRHVQ